MLKIVREMCDLATLPAEALFVQVVSLFTASLLLPFPHFHMLRLCPFVHGDKSSFTYNSLTSVSRFCIFIAVIKGAFTLTYRYFPFRHVNTNYIFIQKSDCIRQTRFV